MMNEEIFKRRKHLVEQLRLADKAHDCARLAAVWSEATGIDPFFFKILLNAWGKTRWTHPGTNRELDAFNKILDDYARGEGLPLRRPAREPPQYLPGSLANDACGFIAN